MSLIWSLVCVTLDCYDILLSFSQLGSLCLSVLYRLRFIKFPMQISPLLAPNIYHLNFLRQSSSSSFNLRIPGIFKCFFFPFRCWCLHFLVSSNVLIHSMYVIYFLKIFFVSAWPLFALSPK